MPGKIVPIHLKALTEKEVQAEIKKLVKEYYKYDDQVGIVWKQQNLKIKKLTKDINIQYGKKYNQIYAKMRPIEKKIGKLHDQLVKLVKNKNRPKGKPTLD